ncbi:MmgE/PrpD family protein [Halalkalibacter wakoensis JCM 9140]|uniref:MmgE/PrpD family protein n=1 Tax=Halalkalibacter wakoensis JCM 9140 TaxID=1236970 RepID=W4Q884_9BACI|nr:MmgE/PrpD family protein [Halalkalibacter wakoensis]GAE27584.1 MmgE/PrpD family protein [Halalkalibacter wakoensis JCM 9140]
MQLHGTATVSNELDEGNQFAKGHPAAHVFAVAYNVSISENVSGKEFIRAFLIGYEVVARLGYASKMKDEMHPHGTWGIVGGVVASAILQRKTEQEIIEAVLLASTLPLATSWESAVTGMTVRNLYTGIACEQAMNIVEYEKAGFKSSLHVVEHVWSHILSENMDDTLFLSDLSQPFLLEKNYFKLYPACRFTHSALDAATQLLNENDIDVKGIHVIEVETYQLAARLKESKPKTYLQAKFSIPYLLSVLFHRENLFDCFQDCVMRNPSVLSLAAKVVVKENPTMTNALPRRRPALVRVIYSDQSSIEAYVEEAQGGYIYPLPKQKLREKYRHMLRAFVSEEKIQELEQITMKLDSLPSFSDWVKQITMEDSHAEFTS